MLWINGKSVTSIMTGGKMLSAIWKAGHLVWMAVRSCFGSGIWRPDKPWLDDEKWKENK